MAIVTRTYIEKCNTIVKDNHANLSLNPIMEINYGNMLSRGIIYFDHNKVKKMVEDKTYTDINKLKHILHITNSSSIIDKNINRCGMDSQIDGHKQRAASFDLIFFLIPNEWDNGKGFDYVMDVYNGNHRGISTDGSNWYKFRNHFRWSEEGIYSTETLSKELDLATSPKGNLSDKIIGFQHFDYGNENIELDITCTMNKFITGELNNYGIGIAYAPSFEDLKTGVSQYTGFFTNHTHSFFEPYVETIYDDIINDDRSNFYLDKDNKLYFYSLIGGKYTNLDEYPICTIDDKQYEVKQATKGIYYVEINLSSDDYEFDTMLYDNWSNLKYRGHQFKDIELQFVTKPSDKYFNLGLPYNDDNSSDEIVPSLYGIGVNEKIPRGDIRKVNVECKIPYSSRQMKAVDGLEYRLYVNEGTEEYNVINWQKVEIGYNENYFLINTNELIPHRYFIDIKVKRNMEELLYKKLLQFDIASITNNKKV